MARLCYVPLFYILGKLKCFICQFLDKSLQYAVANIEVEAVNDFQTFKNEMNSRFMKIRL